MDLLIGRLPNTAAPVERVVNSFGTKSVDVLNDNGWNILGRVDVGSRQSINNILATVAKKQNEVKEVKSEIVQFCYNCLGYYVEGGNKVDIYFKKIKIE